MSLVIYDPSFSNLDASRPWLMPLADSIALNDVEASFFFTDSPQSLFDMSGNGHVLTPVNNVVFTPGQHGVDLTESDYLLSDIPESPNWTILTIGRHRFGAESILVGNQDRIAQTTDPLTGGNGIKHGISLSGSTVASTWSASGLLTGTYRPFNLTTESIVGDINRYRTFVSSLDRTISRVKLYGFNGYNTANVLVPTTFNYADNRFATGTPGGFLRFGSAPYIDTGVSFRGCTLLAVQIFKRVLTDAEVQAQFTLLKAGILQTTSNLVGFTPITI